MKISLRSENVKDYAAIKGVNDMTFKRKAEGALVESLRNEDCFDQGLSIVAETDEKVIGHLLFTPVRIENFTNDPKMLALAPMAVLPEYQKKSVGSLMMIYGLQQAKDAGFTSVVVLGHPSYYPRFGFRPASRWKLSSPFPAPDEAFMALELTQGGLTNISGRVVYPKAFDLV